MKKATVWVGIGGLVLGLGLGVLIHSSLQEYFQIRKDPVYAWLDGKAIHASQVHQTIQADLDQLEKNQLQLKRKATEDVIRMILKSRLENEGVQTSQATPVHSQEEISEYFKARNLNPQKMSRSEYENYLRLISSEKTQKQEVKAIQELRSKARVEWNLALASEKEYHLSDNTLPVQGPRFAPVEISLIANYQCPYCPEAEKRLVELQEKYKDKLRVRYFFSFREPDNSVVRASAEASYCAQDQSSFWAYHQYLVSHPISEMKDLFQAADRVGLKKADFELCLTQRKKREALTKDMQSLLSDGIPPEVPGFLINGKWRAAHLPLSELSLVIESEL